MIWLPVIACASIAITIMGCLLVLHRHVDLDEPDTLGTRVAYLGACLALTIVATVITGFAP